MPGRNNASSNEYRFGFNGKEKDDEVKGTANSLDYGMRIYDPRLGKFLSVDPLAHNFAFYTPFEFAGNKPIVAVDLNGCQMGTMYMISDPDGGHMQLAPLTGKDVYQISGQQANLALNGRYSFPSYKSNATVNRFTTSEDEEFVRVSSSKLNNAKGDWMVRFGDIKGKTPSQIRSIYSLTYDPDQMSKVRVPANTPMENGPAAGEEDGNPLGEGGGNQFRVLVRLDDEAFLQETSTALESGQEIQLPPGEVYSWPTPAATSTPPVAPVETTPTAPLEGMPVAPGEGTPTIPNGLIDPEIVVP